jgi:hypothetical protein
MRKTHLMLEPARSDIAFNLALVSRLSQQHDTNNTICKLVSV